jgi:four helix bundle protein
MNKITRFEDLIAWQKARSLTRNIYQLTVKGDLAKDFALSGQMRRATVSVMSNIAEGFERTGLKEFHKFVSIAKASVAELRSQLYVATDVGYLPDVSFNKVYSQAQEVAKILGGLRASLQKQIQSSENQND